jgi:hypothetical protein
MLSIDCTVILVSTVKRPIMPNQGKCVATNQFGQVATIFPAGIALGSSAI